MNQHAPHRQDDADAIWAAAFEYTPDGIAVCDSSDTLVLINQTLREWLHLQSDYALPKYVSDLSLQPFKETHGFSKYLTSLELYTIRDHILSCTRSPAINHNGQPQGTILSFHDITGEVAAQRAHLFLVASLSHEWRTPLTVIKGNTELLLRGVMGAVNDEQQVALQHIHNMAVNLSRLNANTIMYANIQADALLSNPEPLQLRDILTEIVERKRADFAAKNLDLQIDIPLNMPAVYTDPGNITSLMVQLLNNACDFTRKGSVTVQAQAEDGFARVDVSDTGIGIPEKEQIHLFKPFFHVPDSKITSGTGLGLFIVRALVELQGGRIWVDSRPGVGSTFSFTVPLAAW